MEKTNATGPEWYIIVSIGYDGTVTKRVGEKNAL